MKIATYKLHHKQQGFTLIEVMVVVVIIGIIASLITTNLSRDVDRLARQEARRFHVLVDEVRDEAILAGQYITLSIHKRANTYEFTPIAGVSSNLSKDDLLKKRTLQSGVRLKVKVQSKVVDKEESGIQRILISPVGEIEIFEADFIGKKSKVIIYVNENNQLARRVEKVYIP